MSSYYNNRSNPSRTTRNTSTSSRTPIASSTKNIPTETSQEILRTLLKQTSNKHCADCKTATHPRWASWNIGIFICIRCSGIHRSMGTHISRVKSVDLDDWTQDQIESMIAWGNGRANQYWEAKLPDNYRPDESKIDNYIKTKYDLKRWVASAQIPDPKTLTGAATNGESVSVPAVDATARAPVVRGPMHLGGSKSRPVVSSSQAFSKTVPPTPAKNTPVKNTPVKNTPAPQADLLSLDFSAPVSSSPSMVNSVSSVSNSNPTASASASASAASAAVSNAQSTRPDLKKSILSLYSSPRPQQSQYQQHQQQHQQHHQQQQHQQHQQSFNFFDSASTPSTTSASSSVIDPFSSLSLSNNTGFFSSSSNTSHTKSASSSFSTPTYPSSNTTTAHHTVASSYNTGSNYNKSSSHNNDDDEWSVFTSGSTANSATITTLAKPVADDLFANVWN